MPDTGREFLPTLLFFVRIIAQDAFAWPRGNGAGLSGNPLVAVACCYELPDARVQITLFLALTGGGAVEEVAPDRVKDSLQGRRH